MQDELSWLTARLRQPNSSALGNGIDEAHDRVSWLSPGPGFVIRDTTSQIERYYGPWTLLAHCRRLEAALGSYVGMGETDVSKLSAGLVHDNARSHEILSCSDAVPPRQSDIRVCLPPKQILCVMLGSFLKNLDYATDIFDHQSLHAAVDRVYNDPSAPDTEAWNLCFNLIVLLGLAVENTLHAEDPFVRPILQAIDAAVKRSWIFTEPRLISVQALALCVSLLNLFLVSPCVLTDILPSIEPNGRAM